MSRLCLKSHQMATETTTEMSMATGNPTGLFSIPLMRFMPNNDAINVGNIIRMDTDVSVRITVFMLLLMMLE